MHAVGPSWADDGAFIAIDGGGTDAATAGTSGAGSVLGTSAFSLHFPPHGPEPRLPHGLGAAVAGASRCEATRTELPPRAECSAFISGAHPPRSARRTYRWRAKLR